MIFSFFALYRVTLAEQIETVSEAIDKLVALPHEKLPKPRGAQQDHNAQLRRHLPFFLEGEMSSAH